jgi:RimJ/RimL family protein N-acetyltransferase
MTPLRTQRLLLRRWRPDDRDPFAALNADPRVMEFFPAVLDREQSDAQADAIERHFQRHGYGLWALEVPGVTPFAGFVGLNHVPYDTPFTPAVEVGWRLAAELWGHGYATEAASAALAHGFTEAALTEIVSFTTPVNLRSLRVMERIGMTRDRSGDFDHPRLPAGHALRRHVLYRIGREDPITGRSGAPPRTPRR